ncbi:hypothetical protein [Archangium sp.]|uniref:hypothetical protein n=1 Tax=Archangium sp. TaxID=1872627 RepID=UPI00389A3AAA
MDEEKKWEARTQVGPYQLEEQMPQDPGSPGELYVATHEESGATALVLKPAADKDAAPIPDFQVSFMASEEKDYLALEVKDSRRARAPDRHSADALVELLGDVHEGVGRMARALDGPEEPRPLWRLGFALGSTAAVCALAFALGRLASGSPPPSGPEFLASTPPGLIHDEAPPADGSSDPFFNAWLSDTVDAGEPVITRPLPPEPFKGQKRPPCTRYVEVELVGGCWAAHELKAPCPDTLFEHQGKCYLPSFSAKPPPQSVGP